MNKVCLTVIAVSLILLIVGCSPSSMTAKRGDPFRFENPNADLYIEFPSEHYMVVDTDPLLGHIEGTTVLRNTERKMSITFSITPTEGHKTAGEFRNAHLPSGSMLIDPQSIHTYEKDSIPYTEYNLNEATGYVARFVEAFYIKDKTQVSVLVYVSHFDESKDRSVCDDVFKSVVFRKREIE